MAKDYIAQLNGEAATLGARLKAVFSAKTAPDQQDRFYGFVRALGAAVGGLSPESDNVREAVALFRGLLDAVPDEIAVDESQEVRNRLEALENKIAVCEKQKRLALQRRILERIEFRMCFVQEVLGECVDFALHDIRGLSSDSPELDHSIMSVAGNVSGRSPGAPMTDKGRQMLKEGTDRAIYRVDVKGGPSDGHKFVSGTVVIRDYEGDRIGVLCLNVDTTLANELGAAAGCDTIFGRQHLQTEEEHFERTSKALVRRKMEGLDWKEWKKLYPSDWIGRLEEELFLFSTDYDEALRCLAGYFSLSTRAVERVVEEAGITRKKRAR